MHVLFVNYHWFDNTSGIHIFHLANALERRGVRCSVLVPRRPQTVATFGSPRFSVQTFRQAWLRHMLRGSTHGNEGILVHAWTPREIVRRASLDLAARLRAPYLVHLEDNERHIYLAYRTAARNAARQWGHRQPKRLIDPRHWRSFLAGAAGITCIVDSLLRFRPAHVPGQVFWPACEPEIFDLPMTPDAALRQSLGIPDGTIVLFYPGNVHPANVGDVAELYRAVALLAQRGLPICLVRTGKDRGDLKAQLDPPPYLIHLGHLPANEVPRLLGVADVLVQPGRADAFNIYRFPCKLPMFLASGRPVVLPACNIGEHLRDGEHCLITRTGSAEEIAEKVARLAADPGLRLRLGGNGRAFAMAQLHWDVAAARLFQFYQRTLAAASDNRPVAN
jgi:glycosyltransferase involved in cell wall biosynthesis